MNYQWNSRVKALRYYNGLNFYEFASIAQMSIELLKDIEFHCIELTREDYRLIAKVFEKAVEGE